MSTIQECSISPVANFGWRNEPHVKAVDLCLALLRAEMPCTDWMRRGQESIYSSDGFINARAWSLADVQMRFAADLTGKHARACTHAPATNQTLSIEVKSVSEKNADSPNIAIEYASGIANIYREKVGRHKSTIFGSWPGYSWKALPGFQPAKTLPAGIGIISAAELPIRCPEILGLIEIRDGRWLRDVLKEDPTAVHRYIETMTRMSLDAGLPAPKIIQTNNYTDGSGTPGVLLPKSEMETDVVGFLHRRFNEPDPQPSTERYWKTARADHRAGVVRDRCSEDAF